jgi:2-polyprenyl-3-methyl-5-hydroxy-6-metoxy-1,4-benzoquinol methylase
MAYVNYYDQINNIPVDQSFVDLSIRLQRRRYLLSSIGVFQRDLQGASVLEFGPGTGDNAVTLSHMGIQRIRLVDGSEAAIGQICRRIEAEAFRCPVDVTKSLFMDYESKEKYDLVLAEGCIPFQRDVRNLLKKILAHLSDNGVAIITYLSLAGLISELLRRVLARVLFNDSSFDVNVKLAADFFSRDLSALGTTTRSPVDWVHDAIFHPWQKDGGQIFTIRELCDVLEGSYLISGTLPRPQAFGSWYKQVERDFARRINSEIYVAEQLAELRKIDIRVPQSAVVPMNCIDEFPPLAEALLRHAGELECGEGTAAISAVRCTLHKIRELLSGCAGFEIVCLSFDEVLSILQSYESGRPADVNEARARLIHFSGMWGRCQYYASIRPA